MMRPDAPHSTGTLRQALFRQEAVTAITDNYIGAALFNFHRTLIVPAAVLFLGLLAVIAGLAFVKFNHIVRISGNCCSASSAIGSSAEAGGILYVPERLRPFVRVGDPVTITLDTGASINGAISGAGVRVIEQPISDRIGATNLSRYVAVEWRVHKGPEAPPPAGGGRNQTVVASVVIDTSYLQWAINLLSHNRKRV